MRNTMKRAMVAGALTLTLMGLGSQTAQAGRSRESMRDAQVRRQQVLSTWDHTRQQRAFDPYGYRRERPVRPREMSLDPANRLLCKLSYPPTCPSQFGFQIDSRDRRTRLRVWIWSHIR